MAEDDVECEAGDWVLILDIEAIWKWVDRGSQSGLPLFCGKRTTAGLPCLRNDDFVTLCRF